LSVSFISMVTASYLLKNYYYTIKKTFAIRRSPFPVFRFKSPLLPIGFSLV
jgi:hypothetical protein